jgi:hypothetical protein
VKIGRYIRLLVLGEGSQSHVILHHAAFFKLVSDEVHNVWAGHLKKLLEVIDRLSCLALEVMLSSGNLLIGVNGLLVVVTLIVASSNCDLLQCRFGLLLLSLPLLLTPLPAALGNVP